MVLYAAFALVVSWPSWPGDPSRLRTDNFGILGAGDFDQEVWFLGWTAHALVHVLNPFYTTTLNYPFGIDIAQNTSTPLLGLLTAPLTWLFGPVASMNLLVWLAFPLSAASMFFVVRRFVAWDVAAFVGGAFYGFSPWILTQGLYHLNLCFVPLPPVILLSVYELFRREQRHPVRWGVALGLLTVAQFFITPEICAITLLVALVGVVACGASSASSVWPTIRRSCRGLGVAAGIVIACVAYPTYVTFYGQGHYAGLRPPGPGGEGADLLGPLLPTSREVFTLGHLGAIGSGLTFGNSSENGSYLGVPLLVLIILIVVRYWRRPWIRFCASMMLVTFVLSLGDHVDINNSRTAIALPDQLVQNLVIFRNVIQVRFGLLVTFFAGALVALGLDEMHRRAIPVAEASTVKSPFALNSLWANTRSILLYTLWILCVLTLLPKVPLPSVSAAVPPYFSSSAVDRIPANSVVLTYPYPSIYDLEPQVWQAVAQVRYKILGGYGAFSTGPSAGNYSYATPAALTPADVEAYLLGEAYSPTGSGGSVPVLSQHLECDARTFLRHYNVGTVLVGLMASPIGPDPAAVSTLFRRALGPPSVTDGQVRAWYHVKRDILENRSGLACSTG
ncbi:MAG TPA: hypothetical protein VND83_00850 [Acidimicrobiales bacterium]|nr:hypothetical protein [Acidimicrobiales bacterium]